VVVVQSGTLKIDTVTCNPPLIAVKQPTSGTGTGTAVGSGTNLDGTYTISLLPGDDACGSASLRAEILTVNGATASITPVGGGIPSTGRATTTASTFSMHLTNGITDAPGAIAIDLTGRIEPNGDLSGQSANGGVYPGGTNGFSCNYPFTATRTSVTAGPSATGAPATTPSASSAAPCTAAAITAAARAVDGANFDGLDPSSPSFGCSGRFAYAFAIVGSGTTKNGVTILFMATNGTWQPVNRGIFCQNGSVPQEIYQQACESN
jgi:hypothetical protein